jgi:hypothetical protein
VVRRDRLRGQLDQGLLNHVGGGAAVLGREQFQRAALLIQQPRQMLGPDRTHPSPLLS